MLDICVGIFGESVGDGGQSYISVCPGFGHRGDPLVIIGHLSVILPFKK